MNYSSSSPGNYGGPPGSTGPPGPGTPIMPSPQDSSNSGGENMYTMMKPVPGGNMPGVSIPCSRFCCTCSTDDFNLSFKSVILRCFSSSIYFEYLEIFTMFIQQY